MTNQQINQEAPALTVWKPLEIGKGTAIVIVQAQNQPVIRQLDDEDLKKILRYVMILVGLRGNNLPTDEEKYVLINFIRSSYANQTLAEIKLAFEMAVAGKFTVDVKCYENFSCEYFGRIMNAYIEFARQETKNIPKQIEAPKPTPSDDQLRLMSIKNANDHAESFKKSKESKGKMQWLEFGLSSLYDDLLKYKIWQCPVEIKREIWIKLKPKYTNEIELIAECKKQCYLTLIAMMAEMDVKIGENGEFI
jgi:hypothetical protein